MEHRSLVTINTLEAPGLKIAVFHCGKGDEPVLFIHGLGANHECWKQAPRYFDLERYTLYAVDLPGFGASAKPDSFSYSMPTLADCLSQLVQSLALEPLHLVAHSMGGIVALLMADKELVNLRSLTLAEGNLVGTDAFMSANIAKRSEITFVENYDFWISLLPTFMTDESEDLRRRYADSLRQTSALAMYRASKSCAEWSQSETLSAKYARLTCPRAYLVGEKTRQRRALPQVVVDPSVTLFEVAGAGHFMMENPDRFYPPIAHWMNHLTTS